MKRTSIILLTTLVLLAPTVLKSCVKSGNDLTKEELRKIECDSLKMRIFTVANISDSIFLRKKCSELGRENLCTPAFARLAEKMKATLCDPVNDGVGIAAPQVGISRRVIAVMRLDKEGSPVEVYPDIRITEMRGEMETGSEGCLSVPAGYVPGTDDVYADVARYRDIEISYVSPATLKDTTENVNGFTAVIFQHECDHLDGVLFIDKVGVK